MPHEGPRRRDAKGRYEQYKHRMETMQITDKSQLQNILPRRGGKAAKEKAEGILDVYKKYNKTPTAAEFQNWFVHGSKESLELNLSGKSRQIKAANGRNVTVYDDLSLLGNKPFNLGHTNEIALVPSGTLLGGRWKKVDEGNGYDVIVKRPKKKKGLLGSAIKYIPNEFLLAQSPFGLPGVLGGSTGIKKASKPARKILGDKAGQQFVDIAGSSIRNAVSYLFPPAAPAVHAAAAAGDISAGAPAGKRVASAALQAAGPFAGNVSQRYPRTTSALFSGAGDYIWSEDLTSAGFSAASAAGATSLRQQKRPVSALGFEYVTGRLRGQSSLSFGLSTGLNELFKNLQRNNRR